MVKDQLIEVGKGETLFLVSEAPGFEFEVKCEEADRLSVAGALSHGLVGAGDEDDDKIEVRSAELFNTAADWQKEILRDAPLQTLTDHIDSLVMELIADGIAERLLPRLSGKIKAVVRHSEEGTERTEVLDERTVSGRLSLSAYDWFLCTEESCEVYSKESVMLAKRFLEAGCWQTGPVCKVKKNNSPSLFFGLPDCPRKSVFRPLAVCAKDSVETLGDFVESLQKAEPLGRAGLVRDLRDEPALAEDWERLLETCPLNVFEKIEDRIERGRRIRKWLTEEGDKPCRRI